MRIIKMLASCTCLLLSGTIYLQAKEWRGIVPLHSTGADVERLLGPGEEHCKCVYNFEDENVFINYSDGSCSESEFGGWNVPRDTVIEIVVTPKKDQRFSDLHLDVSKYEKIEDSKSPVRSYYEDWEEGVAFTVHSGMVESVEYWPAAKDVHLRCSQQKGRAFTKHGQPCPTVQIDGSSNIGKSNKLIVLHVLVTGLDRFIQPTYTWRVSAGRIISGQGTATLTIDINELTAQNIIATVEVVGIPMECPQVASYSFAVTGTSLESSTARQGSRGHPPAPKLHQRCPH